jgi:hypothetical protein
METKAFSESIKIRYKGDWNSLNCSKIIHKGGFL